MPLQQILSAIAGVLFLAGFAQYIRAILKGETKPAKASWLIWATLDYILIAGLYAKGAVNGQIIGAVIGVTAVAILAMRYGKPGWTIVDKLCLTGAALGIGLWWIFESPLLGILTVLTIIFLGGIPTFVSAFYHPEREDRTAWTILWFSCLTAVLAIPSWTLVDAAQPVSFLASESIMMYLLYVQPRKM